MARPEPTRVLHVITSLELGGAEMMLAKLLTGIDRDRYTSEVISLTTTGSIGSRLAAAGVPVRALGMRPSNAVSRMIRLGRWVRETRPHIVQTWMYHADVLAGVVARLTGFRSVIWNVRASTLEEDGISSRTRALVRSAAALSNVIPKRIVCVSESARAVHGSLGYDTSKMTVIPNGFDLSEFRADRLTRQVMREAVQIPAQAAAVGLIARYHPMKDHATFIRAAATLRATRPETYFVLCGPGVTWQNQELVAQIDQLGLREHFRLLGPRNDVAAIINTLDVVTLCSTYGEGFPNVIGEAMASGIPCVVTPVGASAEIVGDTGVVVPIRDPASLAAGWSALLDEGASERADRSARARDRIEARYSLRAVVNQYEAMYDSIR